MDLEMENDKGDLEAKETSQSCTSEPINIDPPMQECIEPINIDPSMYECIEPINIDPSMYECIEPTKDPPEYENVYKRAPVSLHQIFQELSRDSVTFDTEAAEVLMEMADDFIQAVLEKTFRLVDSKSTKVLQCSDLMMILRSYCDIDVNHFTAILSGLGRYSYDRHLSAMPRKKTEKRSHSREQFNCPSNKSAKKDSLKEFKSVSVGHTENRRHNLFSALDSIKMKKSKSTKKKLHKVTGKKVNLKGSPLPSTKGESVDLISSSSSVSNVAKGKHIDSVSSKSRRSSETYLKPVSECKTILKIDDEKKFLKPTIIPSLPSKHMRNLPISSVPPYSQEKHCPKKSARAKHVHKKSASHVSNSSSHKISSKQGTSLSILKCKHKKEVSSDPKSMHRKTNNKLKRKSHKNSSLKKHYATHTKTSKSDLKKKKSGYVDSKIKLVYDIPKQKQNSEGRSQKHSFDYQFHAVQSLLSKESDNTVSKEEETAAIRSKLNSITEFYANKSCVENRRVTRHPVCSMSLPCKKSFPPNQNTSVVGYVDYIKKAFKNNASKYCQSVPVISDLRENSVEDFMSGESQDLYTLLDPKADNICSYAVYRKRNLHVKNHFMRSKSCEKVKAFKSSKTVKSSELVQSKQITRPRCTNAQMTKNVMCNIPKEFMPFFNRNEKWMVLASSGKHKPESVISSKAVKKCISKIPSHDFVKKKIAAPALYRKSALALLCRNVSAATSYQQAANALLYKELDVANYFKTHADKSLYETTMNVVGRESSISSSKVCPDMYNKIAAPALKKLLPVVANYVTLKQGKRVSSSSAASPSSKPVSHHSNEALSIPVSSPHESKGTVVVSRETEAISKMKVALLEDFYLNQALTLYERGKRIKKMKKNIKKQQIQSKLNNNVAASPKQASETMLASATPYEQNIPCYENQSMDAECVVGPSSVADAECVAGPSSVTDAERVAGPSSVTDAECVAGPSSVRDAEYVAGPSSVTDAECVAGPSSVTDAECVAGPSSVTENNEFQTALNTKYQSCKEALDDCFSFASLSAERKSSVNNFIDCTDTIRPFYNFPLCPQQLSTASSATFCQAGILPMETNISTQKNLNLIQEVTDDVISLQNVSGSVVLEKKNSRHFSSGKKRKRKKSSLSAGERDSCHSEKRKKRKKDSLSSVQEKHSQSLKYLGKKSASSSSAYSAHSSNSFIPCSQSQEPIMVTVPFRLLPDSKWEELSAKLNTSKGN